MLGVRRKGFVLFVDLSADPCCFRCFPLFTRILVLLDCGQGGKRREKCHWSQLKALKVERILICPNEPGGRICRSRWSLVDDGKLSLERFDLQENIA